MNSLLKNSILGIATLASCASLLAQGTAFTYQGRLHDGANPATGIYDLRFTIYDSTNSPGTIIAGPLTNAATVVSNGLFTVTLDFGVGVFSGAGRWLEIGVRPGGGGAFASLVPLQPLTAAPYAITANNLSGTLPAAQLTGTLPDARLSASVSLLGPTIDSAEITDGTIAVADVNAADFNTTFWRNAGNAGTTPGTHFLGTTDNQPLEFKVNGQRGLRLEPNATSPNVIGGFSGNLAGTNVAGAAIAGGGQQNQPNRVLANFATVGGGAGNTASSYGAAVAGGDINSASAFAATVGGGEGNSASGNYATIPGGRQNTATHDALAAGYRAKANHQGAFVWADSTAADFPSTTNNQFNVRASGGARFETGGAGLTVDGAPIFAGNDGSSLAGLWKLGGNAGTTPGTHFLGTTDNQPLEFKVNNQRGLRLEYATDGPHTSVNVIGGYNGNSVAVGVVGATVFGGGSFNGFPWPNTATADFAAVVGGYANTASGAYAFAAGNHAKANHLGAFVWADSTGTDFASTADNQFSVLASGGARYVTGGAGLTVDGSAVALRTGGNAFSGNQSITGGKLGIGTVSPDGMLGVRGGDIGADEGGQNSGTTSFGLRFGGAGSTEFIGSKRTVGENQFGLDFYTANSTRVSIRNNGNVGIGTVSPATVLHVKGANDAEISVESSSAGGHRWTLQSSHGDPAFGRAAFQIIDRTLGAGRMIIWTNGDVGIGFGFAAPASKLHVNGTVTATAFNPPSDRNLKENFTEVSPRAVLDKVAALPISRWNFKGDAATPHVGPMAQDFHAAFGLGTDDKHIATVDADGVALAAIQGLNQKVEEQRSKLEQKQTEITELKQQNAELETRLGALEKLMNRLTVAKGGE